METMDLKFVFNMAHNNVRKNCNCFCKEVITDVTKTNSHANKHFYCRDIIKCFSCYFVV